jgi:HlyD family secretion protein
MERKKIIILVVIGTLAAVAVGVWSPWSRGDKPPGFRSVPVKRGDLVATISATGTLEPQAAVDVGAQVQGIIVAFGKDKGGHDVNWGSQVEAGQVLARIDDSLYAAAVATAKAQLGQATANVIASRANVLQQKANLLYADQNWDRAQKLGPSDALAQSAYDQYKANDEVAKANLAAAEAAVEVAVAAVQQAKANLLTAKINLDYCTIKSPVKGVVIDRRVNIGQTVVSSTTAPSLFLIASDLRKQIQVWVSVNEADVGNIKVGQPVSFTVDAFPGSTFHGRVGQVRLNATMTQNVVTYTIEVDTDNSDGKLLPYLTANAVFEVGRRQAVLLVPNEALRWSPKPNQTAPEPGQKTPDRGSRRDHGGAGRAAGTPMATLWIEAGKFVRPIRVNPGLTDGTFTEVDGKNLSQGLRVVSGEGIREQDQGQATERNPFAPPRFPGQRGGQGQGQGQGEPGQAAPGSDQHR